MVSIMVAANGITINSILDRPRAGVVAGDICFIHVLPLRPVQRETQQRWFDIRGIIVKRLPL